MVKKLGEIPQEVPIGQCEPHPLTGTMRLDYEKNISGLAGSIRLHGLFSAGRAVAKPAGRGYWVYMGNRRLYACVKNVMKTYKVHIDEGLTDQEIISRAMAENATEKKEKLDVRLLEELHYLSSLLSKKYTIREIQEVALAGGMKKESISKKTELFDFLTSEDFERLYRVEEETGFRFELGHLSGIWKYAGGDKGTFFGACACAAAAEDRWTVEGLNEDLVLGAAPTAANIPWFTTIFPELVVDNKQGQKKGDPIDKILKNAANVSKYYCYIPCKKCGFEIPFDYNLQTKGGPVITTYEFMEEGKIDGIRGELDVTYEARIECKMCSAAWNIILRPHGERLRASLEEVDDRDIDPSIPGEALVEPAVTIYSPAFKGFLIVAHGIWYLYDSSLGRRRQMNEEEVKKHKSYFHQPLTRPLTIKAERKPPSLGGG